MSGMTADDAQQYVLLPIYREGLATALGFSQSDIEVNRTGRLSDSQRSSQRRLLARAAVLAALFALIAGLSAWAAIAIGITTGLGVLVLLLSGALAGFAGIFVWYNVPLWRDVDAGFVSSVEGLVRQSEKETDINTGPFTSVPIWAYYWTVDERARFWVSGRAYAALTSARHRIYFLPRSRKVVRAEPIIAPAA